MKFPLGQLLFSAGVNQCVQEDHNFLSFVMKSINRHSAFDWGECCKQDSLQNDLSLQKGGRLFSVYQDDQLKDHNKIWIITESDRRCTTVLFPSEY